jgi:hypothetical protein
VGFAQVRAAALKFPGIEESTSYGTPALKVRGKLLARLHQSGECLVLRSHLIDREILMQSDQRVFFITDHYRDHPWVLVRFSAVDPRALPDLIERAWRLVAQEFIVGEARNKGLSPERLGEVVHVALSTAKPKARYAVVPQRFKNWTLPRLLPARTLDAVIAKQLGLVRRSQARTPGSQRNIKPSGNRA